MNLKEEAKRVLAIEAQAVAALGPRIDDRFLEAVDIIFGCRGKVVTTGIGKSGIIARKLASTFSSTGTPSIFYIRLKAATEIWVLLVLMMLLLFLVTVARLMN